MDQRLHKNTRPRIETCLIGDAGDAAGIGSSCSLKRTEIHDVRETEGADDAAFDIIIKPGKTGRQKANIYPMSPNEDDI